MNSQSQPNRPTQPVEKIRVGISQCLLGEQVRFDGGHKRSTYITEVLSRYFDFQPLCPEVGIGLGVPRPPIRLVGDPADPRAVGRDQSSLDVTDRLAEFAQRQLPRASGFSGFILKKDSPSCGMERVKVYSETKGMPSKAGSGIFARVLLTGMPQLPVEEEGRLNDPVLRENFVMRVFTYHRWQRLLASGVTRKGVIDFHTRHKYLIMVHSQAAYQRMGRLLSDVSGERLGEAVPVYEAELMEALKRRANRKRHVNGLQHIMGYLKRSIDSGDKRELTESIEAYRRGEVPLIVPITLFRHYFRRHPDPYIQSQIYLRPHPDELGLLGQI